MGHLPYVIFLVLAVAFFAGAFFVKFGLAMVVLVTALFGLATSAGSWPSMKPHTSAGSEQPKKDLPLKPRFITNTPALLPVLPAKAQRGQSPKLIGATV